MLPFEEGGGEEEGCKFAIDVV
jgi:hypothetical protein